MEAKEVIQLWISAYNRADIETISALYAENATHHQIATQPVEGRINIKQMFADEFAGDTMTLIAKNIYQDGDCMILEWKDPNGQLGCGIFQINEGKIISHRGYLNKPSSTNQQNSAEHQTQSYIINYQDRYKKQVLDVWEQSVVATHHFLAATDFEEIKAFVKTIDFNDFGVYCLISKAKVLGFIGVLEQKVEMLFIHPDCFGMGYGQKLMTFAMEELQADQVDVNEQNELARKFYTKLGFKTYQRTEQDDLGKDYPILRMQLN